MDRYQLLIGFLSGSFATLIVKELFLQYNKRLDFNRKLTKLTYSRRLETAEKATAYYWTVLNKVAEMKKIYEFMAKALEELNGKYSLDIIKDILDKNGEILVELSKDKYLDINVIHLYFELEDKEKWDESDYSNMIENISELKSIDEKIQFYLNFHNVAKSRGQENEADKHLNEIIEILPEYLKAIKRFVTHIDKNQKAIRSIIDKIKGDLKKY